MSNFQLYADLGLSGTKAAFISATKFVPYLCPPKVADLSDAERQILSAQGEQFGGGIGAGAYLQLGDAAYALADDAAGRANKTTAMLPKSTLAHLRMLGVIGELAQQFHQPQLTLDLGIALPFHEYLSDQHEVTNQLQQVKSFVYRGRAVQWNAQTLKVLPEGAGLVQWRKALAARRGESPSQTYVVVMVGYRDLTFLVFRQGKPPTGEPSGTVRLGYLEYLQAVAQSLCPPDDPFLFEALLQGSETVAFPKQPGKVFALADRRAKAAAFYWEQVQHHLKEKFAALDVPSYELLVGGGTALTLLRPRLEAYLKTVPGATVNWLPDLLREVCTVLHLPDTAAQARFADCFGGAKWLATKFAQVGQVEAAS